MNGVEDDYYEEDEEDEETHGDGALAKGPPGKDRPLAGIQNTQKHGKPLRSFGGHVHDALTRFREP